MSQLKTQLRSFGFMVRNLERFLRCNNRLHKWLEERIRKYYLWIEIDYIIFLFRENPRASWPCPLIRRPPRRGHPPSQLVNQLQEVIASTWRTVWPNSWSPVKPNVWVSHVFVKTFFFLYDLFLYLAITYHSFRHNNRKSFCKDPPSERILPY